MSQIVAALGLLAIASVLAIAVLNIVLQKATEFVPATGNAELSYAKLTPITFNEVINDVAYATFRLEFGVSSDTDMTVSICLVSGSSQGEVELVCQDNIQVRAGYHVYSVIMRIDKTTLGTICPPDLSQCPLTNNWVVVMESDGRTISSVIPLYIMSPA